MSRATGRGSRVGAAGIIALAVLAIARPAAAQNPSPAPLGVGARLDSVPLLSGTRVRVTAAPLGPRAKPFRFAGTRGDSLLLRAPQGNSVDTTAVRLSDVSLLEVSRGWRRRALVGGIIGVVAGAAIGAAVGYQAWDESRRNCVSDSYSYCGPRTRGGLAVSYGLNGMGLGGAAGALWGRFVLGERWERIDR